MCLIDVYPGESRYLIIWQFRLQKTDSDFKQLDRDRQGDPSIALPVEIRAEVINGPQLRDGDKVKVCGYEKDSTISAKEIVNHSAGGARITVRGWAGRI